MELERGEWADAVDPAPGSAMLSWLLTEGAGFAYKVTDYYSPAGERTIAVERSGSWRFPGR